MFGWTRTGVLGACVALAGALAYFVWNRASFSGERCETRPGEDREEGDGEEDEDEFRPAGSGGAQVLVLGLSRAGKTSLLHCLATGCLEHDTVPTQGFNIVSINRENLHIKLLEIGGHEMLRPFRQRYMSTAQLLVFVVDSSNPQLFPEAKKHLHELLVLEPHLPLMVLANKQDLPGACSITELHDALSLSEIGGRRLFLFSTHMKTELSSDLQKARDLMIQMFGERK